MIFRLSFLEGIPVSKPEEVKAVIAQHEHEAVRLEPGEYDLTPSWWGNNVYAYAVNVHLDGTATMRMVPRSANGVTFELLPAGCLIDAPREREFSIPGNQSTAVVLGFMRDGTTFGVFEIIVYLPERTTVQLPPAWLN